MYELINYGEHGTTVDEVFYSCDVSVLITGGGSGSKNQTKKSSAKNNTQHRTSASSNLDSVRQLISTDKIGGGDPADFTASSNAYGKVCVMCIALYSVDYCGSRKLCVVLLISRRRSATSVAQSVCMGNVVIFCSILKSFYALIPRYVPAVRFFF